jgi:Patatin-like phospholipase
LTTLGDEAPATAERDQGLRERVPASERWVAARLGDAREHRRLRWRYLASGFRPEPIPAHREPVEDPTPGRTGICCSGGGIRSAAFNLGALQKLQEAGRLQQAEYLAAVSGGSYIAAAFAMVAQTTADGSSDDSDLKLIEREDPFAHGSPEEQYLRNRSDYLAPDGLAKLYLGYRVVLGLLVNLIFVALPIFGATMLLGVLLYRHSFSALVTCAPGMHRDCTAAGSFHHRGVHLPLLYWLIPVVLAGASAALGVFVMLPRVSTGRGGMLLRVPTGRGVRSDGFVRAMQFWSARLLVGAALLALLTVALPELVALFHVHGKASGATAGTSSANAVGLAGGGVAGLLAGIVAVLRDLFAEANKAVTTFSKLSARVRRLIAYAAAAILGPLLLYAVAVFSMSFTLANAGPANSHKWLFLGGLGALALFALLYNVADITALSLHPFYKRRLCTAFALKRIRPKPSLTDTTEATAEQARLEQEAKEDKKAKKSARKAASEANAAAGADTQQPGRASVPGSTARERANAVRAADDQQLDRGVAVERNYDNLVRLSKTGLDSSKWPTLLVCAAANISEPGATPPGRRVTSFTFSCSTIGGPLVGAARTQKFEDVFKENGGRRRDLSLPAAVAMSGAAIAPSMGKMTPRPLTFLLALANIRLGVWVPNPRWVAGSTESWRRRRPTPSYLIRELIGRNRVDSRYLFVTDGGHYENLGLVELLRRGCTKIYCFDASGGEGFDALGDAVALARSELGVEIDINPDPLMPGSAKRETEGACCTKGATRKVEGEGGAKDEALAAQIAVSAKFVYRNGTEGELVYARNVMSPGAPWDVRAHHRTDPSFPHNSTVDQLYTDQKFESYRVLGVQAGGRALMLMGASARATTRL